MLVLSRKLGEEIVIGDSIVLRVISAGHGRVRLGIDAPPDVPIKRAELLPQSPKRDGNPEKPLSDFIRGPRKAA